MKHIKQRTTLLKPTEVESDNKTSATELRKKYNYLRKKMLQEMYDRRVIIQKKPKNKIKKDNRKNKYMI